MVQWLGENRGRRRLSGDWEDFEDGRRGYREFRVLREAREYVETGSSVMVS
jgi:hypothetical protein